MSRELDSPLTEYSSSGLSEGNLLKDNPNLLLNSSRTSSVEHTYSADLHHHFDSNEDIFMLPSWKYAGYAVCYLLSVLLFFLSLGGPIGMDQWFVLSILIPSPVYLFHHVGSASCCLRSELVFLYLQFDAGRDHVLFDLLDGNKAAEQEFGQCYPPLYWRLFCG
jgi:hypothetical protein